MILLSLLSSCVSIPSRQPVPLSPDLQPFFKPCAPSDGGHAFQLSHGDQLVGQAEVQWLAAAEDNWEMEVNNTFGQRLGRWTLKPQSQTSKPRKLHQDSNLLKKLPPVELDPEGFILVDGHWIALQGHEIPCILNGFVPLQWAQVLVAKKKEGSLLRLNFDHPDRSMEVTLSSQPSLPEATYQTVKLCARTKWSQWVLWNQELEWCTLRQKKAPPSRDQTIKGEYPDVRMIEVFFRGYEDFYLRFVPLEGPKNSP